MPPPLITLDRIAVRRRDRWLLNGLSWRINVGDQWTVIGPNGAGKSTLAMAIAGLLPVVQGTIRYHAFVHLSPLETIAYASSDDRRGVWRRERQLDHGRSFAGRFEEATTVGHFIGRSISRFTAPQKVERRLADLARRFRLEPLLDKSIMAISTGEMSRVLVARQLIHRPEMLILDEPFDGLDGPSRQELMGMLDQLAVSGLPIMLITHRFDDILPSSTHVLTMDRGRIVSAAAMEGSTQWDVAMAMSTSPTDLDGLHPHPPAKRQSSPAPLIDMQAVTVRYGDTVVLDRFTWTMEAGEHWAITGPNGAGKSTILKLITGECLQVYANRIRLFGKDRGADQTLWQVRSVVGLVSHDLASGYQKQMSALDVVCSGFFDSVGLYRHCDADQIDTARQWLRRMGISALAARPFNRLSQGQRQMVLIVRAMVKSPKLLILDEPCSGLDPSYRQTVLEWVTRIGRRSVTGVIFVSHHEQEIPACITHRLCLDRGRVVYHGTVRGS